MDNFEFAQSVPEATSLGIKGIKHAKDLWLEMLRRSKKSIDVGQFYITSLPNEAMEPVLKIIKEKALSGIRVRVLVDKNMAELDYFKEYFDSIKGIELRLIDLMKVTGSIMHAKYMIIDQADVFIGSQNFDWRSLTQVHEIGFRIQNEKFASLLLKVFETDWRIAKTKKLPAFRKGPRKRSPELSCVYKGEKIMIRPAFSPAVITPLEFSTELDEVLGLINNAEKSIMVSVMEYSMTSHYSDLVLTKIDTALREASLRGISVKLLFTDWASKEPSISYIKSLSLMPNIDVKLSSIPQLKKRFIPFARVSHCKFMVVDSDLLWIGTTNWEPDYFLASRNMSIVIKGKNTNKKLRELFTNTWDQGFSRSVDASKKYIPPRISG
ncbi:MAG: hypothetical protein KKH98_11780 [Spirochaetes bacterium]|nr:hypothetical protein [Spirochaetota bacterium]